MNQYVTGSVIKRLREKQKLPQSLLADFLGVSDRTVSKWETGRGFPDITFFLSRLRKSWKFRLRSFFPGRKLKTAIGRRIFQSWIFTCARSAERFLFWWTTKWQKHITSPGSPACGFRGVCKNVPGTKRRSKIPERRKMQNLRLLHKVRTFWTRFLTEKRTFAMKEIPRGDFMLFCLAE